MVRKVELVAPLAFLALHELRTPLSGSKLAKRLGKRRSSVLSPGTIYPLLKRLHRQKLIRYRSSGGEKIYFLTDDGLAELNNLYKDFSKLFKGLKSKIR